ncbi:LysM peptidoglycan-binding domain-containing protein [Spirochaeta cellobiosiphila]|uniref:LysM peptidoglycan-binding domain-containing protein n=1 Tax=Spirochaeta cellobiosiphila TaxID=504483 RepID=UPI0003F65307|nr:LysM peptidoglycan-binding domain-containing protein [Spirochaeta cellobiosiphila]
MLGIKQADGTFYAIMDEKENTSKRVVLTTSHGGQKGVKVPIFKGQGEEMANATPVGVLTLDLGQDSSSSPELHLTVGVDSESVFSGTLEDPETGEKQHLSISLETDTMNLGMFDVPDFDLDPDEGTTAQDILNEFPDAEDVAGQYEEEPEEFSTAIMDENDLDNDGSYYGDDQRESKKGSTILKAGFIVLALALLAIVIYLVLGYLRDRPESEPSMETKEPVSQVMEEADESVPPPTPVTIEPEKEVAPVEVEVNSDDEVVAADPVVVTHLIKWGDTLWDLSANYYRNPWLYGHIANFNEIPNPDLIYAGDTLLIPEK